MAKRLSATVPSAQEMIVTHRSRHSWLRTLLTVFAIVGAFYTGFVVGTWRQEVDAAALAAMNAVAGGRAEAASVSAVAAAANRDRDVDAGANVILRETIKSLHDDVGRLEEEVEFYKRLMSPNEVRRGLRIENLTLEAAGGPRQYGYDVLLTQVVDRHSFISGEVELQVTGREDGEQQVLSLTELAAIEPYPLKYRFRFFQDLVGVLSLPESFEPETVRVVVKPAGGRSKLLEREFPWQAIDG